MYREVRKTENSNTENSNTESSACWRTSTDRSAQAITRQPFSCTGRLIPRCSADSEASLWRRALLKRTGSRQSARRRAVDYIEPFLCARLTVLVERERERETEKDLPSRDRERSHLPATSESIWQFLLCGEFVFFLN